MKKTNTSITIILIFGIALIGIGIGFNFLTLPNDEEKIEESVPTEKVRNYTTIKTVEENRITSQALTNEDLGNTSKEIGFDNVSCADNSCSISKLGYENSEYEDGVSISLDENNNRTVSAALYFHKDDFTIDNIYSELNAVINNYFGTEITKSQITEVKKGFDASGNKALYIKTYISGQYTVELNMQKVEKSDFYLVKHLVLSTDLYNLYHNAN